MEPAASTTVQIKKARAPIPRKWSMHYGQDLQSPTPQSSYCTHFVNSVNLSQILPFTASAACNNQFLY